MHSKPSSRLKRLSATIEDFIYRVVLKNLLKLSALGYGLIVTGAESGANFERIYNNKPEGTFILGPYLDKILLNLPAAKATRGRKDEIKQILWNEIYNNKVQNKKTRILDLASGGARYIRELAIEHKKDLVESICLDKDLACVRLGRQLSKAESLTNIKFLRGDIFKLHLLKRFAEVIRWVPNVIVASGLFIYFNDNKVTKLLKEMHAILPPAGIVVFQSYENLNTRKLMRKTMSTSSGEEWTLYYRKPYFWRKLLNEIGFESVFITRDRWQMNNVCVARKK